MWLKYLNFFDIWQRKEFKFKCEDIEMGMFYVFFLVNFQLYFQSGFLRYLFYKGIKKGIGKGDISIFEMFKCVCFFYFSDFGGKCYNGIEFFDISGVMGFRKFRCQSDDVVSSNYQNKLQEWSYSQNVLICIYMQ